MHVYPFTEGTYTYPGADCKLIGHFQYDIVSWRPSNLKSNHIKSMSLNIGKANRLKRQHNYAWPLCLREGQEGKKRPTHPRCAFQVNLSQFKRCPAQLASWIYMPCKTLLIWAFARAAKYYRNVTFTRLNTRSGSIGALGHRFVWLCCWWRHGMAWQQPLHNDASHSNTKSYSSRNTISWFTHVFANQPARSSTVAGRDRTGNGVAFPLLLPPLWSD